MGTIQGQASGRYGAWVLQVNYSASPVSNGAYFNVHAELRFITTGTATIQKNAVESAYINLMVMYVGLVSEECMGQEIGY